MNIISKLQNKRLEGLENRNWIRGHHHIEGMILKGKTIINPFLEEVRNIG